MIVHLFCVDNQRSLSIPTPLLFCCFQLYRLKYLEGDVDEDWRDVDRITCTRIRSMCVTGGA